MTIFVLLSCMANIGPDSNNLNVLNNIIEASNIEGLSLEGRIEKVNNILNSSAADGSLNIEEDSLLSNILQSAEVDLEIIKLLWSRGIIIYSIEETFKEAKLSFDIAKFLLDNAVDISRRKALKSLLDNEKISKDDKGRIIIHMLSNYTSATMKFYYKNLNFDLALNKILRDFGDRIDIVEKALSMGIKEFSLSELVERKDDINPDVLKLVCKGITQDQMISFFVDLIRNKDISIETKASLLDFVLEKELNIEKCNELGLLSMAIELSENSEIIGKLKEKGIEVIQPLSSVEQLEQLVDKLGLYYTEEYMVDLLKSSAKEVDPDIIGFFFNEFAEKNKRELKNLIKYMYEKNLFQKLIDEFFSSSKYINIEAVELIFDKLDSNTKVICFEKLIQNKRISEEEKIKLIKAILDRGLDAKICKKRKIIGTASEYLGDNKQIMDLMMWML